MSFLRAGFFEASVSLGVIAGMLMPFYSVLQMWPVKACCLFIVYRHRCGQMCLWTYYNDTMNNNADSIYNVACIIMIVGHTVGHNADWEDNNFMIQGTFLQHWYVI